MASIDPKQIKQDSATQGQGLIWNGQQWAPGAVGGGSAAKVSLGGFTTDDLANGDFVYAPTTTPLKTDALDYAKSQCMGAYEGTSGELTLAGPVDSAKFTTAGGLPENGKPVYLAKSTDDGDTGAGKLTPIAPTARGQFIVEVGLCYDNDNYVSLKTCGIIFNPQPVIKL